MVGEDQEQGDSLSDNFSLTTHLQCAEHMLASLLALLFFRKTLEVVINLPILQTEIPRLREMK